jgi:hypothetical protein
MSAFRALQYASSMVSETLSIGAQGVMRAANPLLGRFGAELSLRGGDAYWHQQEDSNLFGLAALPYPGRLELLALEEQ